MPPEVLAQLAAEEVREHEQDEEGEYPGERRDESGVERQDGDNQDEELEHGDSVCGGGGRQGSGSDGDALNTREIQRLNLVADDFEAKLDGFLYALHQIIQEASYTMATAARELDATQETVDWSHDALGLTYEEIGATLGVSERTLCRSRNGLNLPRRSQRERLEDLRGLRYLLAQVFPQPADRDEWLRSSSRLLRGRTPISLLRQGRVVTVRDALATLETGAFLRGSGGSWPVGPSPLQTIVRPARGAAATAQFERIRRVLTSVNRCPAGSGATIAVAAWQPRRIFHLATADTV